MKIISIFFQNFRFISKKEQNRAIFLVILPNGYISKLGITGRVYRETKIDFGRKFAIKDDCTKKSRMFFNPTFLTLFFSTTTTAPKYHPRSFGKRRPISKARSRTAPENRRCDWR